MQLLQVALGLPIAIHYSHEYPPLSLLLFPCVPPSRLPPPSLSLDIAKGITIRPLILPNLYTSG